MLNLIPVKFGDNKEQLLSGCSDNLMVGKILGEMSMGSPISSVGR